MAFDVGVSEFVLLQKKVFVFIIQKNIIHVRINLGGNIKCQRGTLTFDIMLEFFEKVVVVIHSKM